MSIFRRTLNRVSEPILARLTSRIAESISIESLHQQTQAALLAQYGFYRSQKIVPHHNIRNAGFRVYSQFEEDGIILYVLAMIGFKSRKVVEICCGSGDECMATNLILNHGFEGFLFDGDEANVNRAVRFFRSKKDCTIDTAVEGVTFQRPIIAHAWISAESVNDLLRQSGSTGEVDLLSLDVDGNEYWIWKALDAITPRLLVVETNHIIPVDKSLTIPYRPDFNYHKAAADDFRGASLLAMAKLCSERGYRLIGAHRHGFNAFFLRNDEGLEIFREITVDEAQDDPYSHWSKSTRWPVVADLPWLEV